MAKVNPIPAGTQAVIPNLTFHGCAEAIAFYEKALGAKETRRAPAPDGKSIWHAELKIGDTVIFVNDDMPGSQVDLPKPERRIPIVFWIATKDCDAAHRRAIEAGAKSTMEPADMFWGDRVAEVVDPFGYRWDFSQHVEDLTPDEMKKAGEEFARKMRAR